MSSTAIIDVKQAVTAAIQFLQRLFPDLPDLRLEEVELSEDGEEWLITLGFLVKQPRTALENVLDPEGVDWNRIYKLVRVDAKTGHAKSMKIRSV